MLHGIAHCLLVLNSDACSLRPNQVPFRTAHHISGSLVGKLVRAGKCFDGNLQECQAHLREHGVNAPDDEVLKVLDTKSVMSTYNCLGGTGPKSVSDMLVKMKAQFAALKATIQKDSERLSSAYEAARAIAAEVSAAKVEDADEFKKIVAKHRATIKHSA